MENIKEAKKALLKKALGFKTKEIVEEYSTTDGEIVLTKKKVTQKTVPPDCMAIKMLMEEEELKCIQIHSMIRLLRHPKLDS